MTLLGGGASTRPPRTALPQGGLRGRAARSASSTILRFGIATGRCASTRSIASRSCPGPSQHAYMMSAAAEERLTPASQWMRTLPVPERRPSASRMICRTSSSVAPSSVTTSATSRRSLWATLS